MVYNDKSFGKHKSYVLMLFRVKDNDIPVEQTLFHELIHDFVKDPSGGRLSIVHGDHRSPSVAFYSMINKFPATKVKGGVSREQRRMNLLICLQNQEINVMNFNGHLQVVLFISLFSW
jgi:uncharacterized protein with WD repeat